MRIAGAVSFVETVRRAEVESPGCTGIDQFFNPNTPEELAVAEGILRV